MHLSLTDFCVVVKELQKSNAQKALVILWFHDRVTPDVAMSAGQLSRILVDHHIGTPNSTTLARQIRDTKLTNPRKDGFVLKPGSRRLIQELLPVNIDGIQPAVDRSAGYLPEAVWKDTRPYIESVCKQFNGCFRSAYYDAALVMLRRLFETLIIESYENMQRKSEIEIGGGNYHMFAGLAERASGKNGHAGLNLGRNTKNALEAVKALGDRSAHDRRFMACASDLTKIPFDVRSGVQDLIQVWTPKK